MAVPSCTTSVFMSASFSLFVSACFLFVSVILLKVRKGKEESKAKQSKAKERKERDEKFCVFCVVRTTRYLSL